MQTILEVMNHNPIVCTADTRVAEVKHLMKKYDYEEILVLDSVEDRRPIGLISLKDMQTEDAEEAEIPSDVSAAECMRAIPAVVSEMSSLNDSLTVMRENFLERIAVVDLSGHFTGLLEKKNVTSVLM